MQGVIAIDPGPEKSAMVELAPDGRRIVHAFDGDNERVLSYIRCSGTGKPDASLVIEKIASYGMPVGAETFETCVWTGRFLEAYRRPADRIPRKEVCVHLCGSARAKDANIRQAIIDRFGGKDRAIGKKAAPGPLYGISGDMWQALAVGLTWLDRRRVLEAAS